MIDKEQGQFQEKTDPVAQIPGMSSTYASADTLGPKPPIRDYATEQSNSVQRAQSAGEADPYAAAKNNSQYSIGSGITSKQPSITAYLGATPAKTAAMRQAVLNRSADQSNYSQGERQLDTAILANTPSTQQRQYSENGQTWMADEPITYMPDNLSQYSSNTAPSVLVGKEMYAVTDAPSRLEDAIVQAQRALDVDIDPSDRDRLESRLQHLKDLYSASLANVTGAKEGKQAGFDFSSALRKGDLSTIGGLLDKTYNTGNNGYLTPEQVRNSARDQANANMSGLSSKASALAAKDREDIAAAQKVTDEQNAKTVAVREKTIKAKSDIETLKKSPVYRDDSGSAKKYYIKNYLRGTYHLSEQEVDDYMSGRRTLEDVMANTAGNTPYEEDKGGYIQQGLSAAGNFIKGLF